MATPLEDSEGQLIDGGNDGQSGSNYVTILTRPAAAGFSPAGPTSPAPAPVSPTVTPTPSPTPVPTPTPASTPTPTPFPGY